MRTHSAVSSRLGTFASSQYFVLQTRLSGYYAVALGVFSQEVFAFSNRLFMLFSFCSLHTLMNFTERVAQGVIVYLRCLTGKRVF